MKGCGHDIASKNVWTMKKRTETRDRDLFKAVCEVRDLLRDIDQKISHLIEQNSVERMCFYRGEKDGEYNS